jgi:hypothetical protein
MRCHGSLSLPVLAVLATTLALSRATAAANQQAPCPPAGDTLSLLEPQDPGYSEAQEFARFLKSHHIELHCITRTTLGSYFLGEPKSAGFQTDLGPISVAFLPPPDGAERITTVLKVSHGRYRYTFRTKQPGLTDHQVIETDSPLHFLVKGRWFVFVDSRAEEALRLAFAGMSQCCASH